MLTYEISKGSWSCFMNFESLEDAQAWADARGPGHIVTLASDNEQIIQPTAEDIATEKLVLDASFCNGMLVKLDLENRLTWPLDKADAKTQQKKFEEYVKFLQRSNIVLSKEELTDLAVDVNLTQETKDAWLADITNYLT